MRKIVSPLDGLTSPLGGFTSFRVLSLFAAGEVGAWYDPSDFTTMFQDSAGTTPVTAVEQPVGLLLDKSKGLAQGAELVTNGDFAIDANWTKETGWSISGGKAVFTSGGTAFANIYQSFTTVVGRSYTLRYDLGVVSAGTTSVKVYSGTGILGTVIGSANFIAAPTTQAQLIFVATATTTTVGLQANQSLQNLQFDNISVKELAGNHASQSTAASRPVLSARVNLLTYSEQFDNAAWQKQSPTITANAVAAPDGTTTADKVIPTAVSGVHRIYVLPAASSATVPQTHTLHAKAGENTKIAIGYAGGTAFLAVDLSNGTQITATGVSRTTITSLGNGWYRISTVITGNAGYYGIYILPNAYTSGAPDANAFAGNGSDGLYIWGADLRVTNDGVNLPAYQRVAAATDYDTTGFPLYLKFDGTDDSLATASIDFSATDKMTVFAGVRKLSDASQQWITALGAGATNAFLLQAFTDLRYYYGSGGSGFVQVSSNGTSAPLTHVLTGISNISGPEVTIRVNGAQQNTSAATQGTGNFSNNPLRIGATSIPDKLFNGRLYSLIVRGAASSATQIASTEAWVNNVTKAY